MNLDPRPDDRDRPPDADAVVAVVVTYQPDVATLERLLAALVGQVASVVLVDNASPGFVPPHPPLPLQVIRLDHNLGLAAAQNRGLRAALDAGAALVLLLDQDSRPAAGMVAALQEAGRAAQEAGLRVAALGPLVVDPQGGSEGFVRFRDGRYRAVRPAPGERWVDCDLLIASGTLIPATSLHVIGTMSERLFIDKIDTEWSLRALARGQVLLGVPGARLHHRLGERPLRLWFLGWRELRQHRPFRYYYMVRNGLLLRRLPHATAAWRRADRRQLLSLLLYFGLLAPGRLAALRMMLRGLVDGWRGVGGPLR